MFKILRLSFYTACSLFAATLDSPMIWWSALSNKLFLPPKGDGLHLCLPTIAENFTAAVLPGQDIVTDFGSIKILYQVQSQLSILNSVIIVVQ